MAGVSCKRCAEELRKFPIHGHCGFCLAELAIEATARRRRGIAFWALVDAGYAPPVVEHVRKLIRSGRAPEVALSEAQEVAA